MRLLLFCTLILSATLAGAKAKSATPSKSDNGAPAYLLRYKLAEGETIYYRVTHLGETETRIQGETEQTHSRTVSTKVWQVTDVNEAGEMTFEHRVDSVQLDQKVGEKLDLKWDSSDGTEAPSAFAKVAESIGKPLARVRINSRGQVRERKDFAGTRANLGMGELTIPLPAEPIKVGERWVVPREVRVRDTEGEPKKIKVHEEYRLEKVAAGVATLSVKSSPLTPIDDNAVKAQLVQQLSNGKIRFDLDAGRLLSKELEWDETVVGFRGAESMLEYSARLTEEQVDQPVRTAQKED